VVFYFRYVFLNLENTNIHSFIDIIFSLCYTVIHNSITVKTHGGCSNETDYFKCIWQIKQQIKAAILSGELQAEETLPSLRTLAKDLKISVLTVTKAYTELEQEGFVKNVQGRGCFVMGSGSELIKEQLICKVENNLTEAIKAARMANLSTEELHRLLDILTEVKTDD